MNRLFFSGPLLAILMILSAPLSAQRQGHVEDFSLPMEFAPDTTISLSDFQDRKAVVVVFTSYFCSWSVKYMDRLGQLYTEYKDQEVGFIAINSNDPELEGIVRAEPPAFPFLKDEGQKVAEIFGATKNPEAFLLVPSGSHFKVVYHGKIDDNPLDATMVRNNFLQDALDQTLAGERVEVKETPVAGCSIKE